MGLTVFATNRQPTSPATATATGSSSKSRASLEASGASRKHVVESRRIIKAVLDGCGFATLA
jgi:hypothetical protein